jgi:hypothetical protein
MFNSYEQFDNVKGVIRSRRSEGQTIQWPKEQTMINHYTENSRLSKTNPTNSGEVNSGAPEGFAVLLEYLLDIASCGCHCLFLL